MSAFELFVQTELPLRSALLQAGAVGYDGDPNDAGAPTILKSAPTGTWYLRTTPSPLYYRKVGSGATDWEVSGGGAQGWIRITDIQVQTTGTISDQVYQDPGADTVLQSCTSSTLDITVSVEASFPKVDVEGVAATLPKVGSIYAGDVDITLTGTTTIAAQVFTADDVPGPTDSCTVTVDTPPELLTLTFTGGYPGTQTELKAGDTFQITGTTDKTADAIDILDFGAFSASLETFAAGTSFTVTGTVANRGTTLQALAARVRARNPAGAFGSTRDTNELGGTVDGVNLIKLNNLYPTATIGVITYPVTQGALKGAESATIAMTTANLDTITYDSPNGDLTVTNPTTDEPTKTVTRAAGSYNVTVNNFRATANRAANDATTVSQTVVYIANVAASITVAEPAARLRSGGNNGTAIQNHTITITSDQLLNALPSLSADVGGGTFTGAWAGAVPGATFTRTLQVHDNDTKGTYTWQSLNATNLSGLNTTVITGDNQYVLGGFVARDLTYAAFATSTNMAVEVVDFSKLTAGIFTATNQPALKQPIGTSPPVTNGYTIDALSINPTAVIWLDTSAASSNSSGTAQITAVEETV